VLLVIASVTWAIAETASLQGAAQLLALVVPMLLVLCVFNQPAATAVCRVLSLPLCALPVWDAADLPMQQLTIAGVTGALWLIQLPVKRDGSLLMTPHGTFDVEIGCNGLQMLLAGWTIAAALAVRQRVNGFQYVTMLATAALIAIAANWLRITIVIVVGHVSKMRHYLVSNEHYVLGWLLFGLGMALFAWFASNQGHASAQTSRAVAGPYVSPQAGKWSVPVLPLSASLAGIGPVLFFLSVAPEAQARRVSPSVLPDGLAVRNSDIDWATEPAGAVRWWAVDVRDVGSTADWATVQSLEFERVTQAMDILLSKRAIIDWQDVQIRPDLASRADGFSLAAGVDRNGQRWEMAWRLSVAGQAQRSALQARVRFAAMTLLGARAPIRLERLAVPCALDCVTAEAEVVRLLERLGTRTTAMDRGAG
jgi:exosortase